VIACMRGTTYVLNYTVTSAAGKTASATLRVIVPCTEYAGCGPASCEGSTATSYACTPQVREENCDVSAADAMHCETSVGPRAGRDMYRLLCAAGAVCVSSGRVWRQLQGLPRWRALRFAVRRLSGWPACAQQV